MDMTKNPALNRIFKYQPLQSSFLILKIILRKPDSIFGLLTTTIFISKTSKIFSNTYYALLHILVHRREEIMSRSPLLKEIQA